MSNPDDTPDFKTFLMSKKKLWLTPIIIIIIILIVITVVPKLSFIGPIIYPVFD